MVTAVNVQTGETITVTDVSQLPSGAWRITGNGNGNNCGCASTCPPGGGQQGQPIVTQGNFQVQATPVCNFPTPGPMTYTIKPCLSPVVVDCFRTAMYRNPYLGVAACVDGKYEILKLDTCPDAMSYVYVTDPGTSQAFWILNSNGIWEKWEHGAWVEQTGAPTCPFVCFVDPFSTGPSYYYYKPYSERDARTLLTAVPICPHPS